MNEWFKLRDSLKDILHIINAFSNQETNRMKSVYNINKISEILKHIEILIKYI